jgi:hypothetical protein
MDYRQKAIDLITTRWQRENLINHENEIDGILRSIVGQPPRPANRKPFEGLYGIRPMAEYYRLAWGTIKANLPQISDEILDSLLRVLVNQPPRPEGDEPYIGLFGKRPPEEVQPLQVKIDKNVLLQVPYYSQRDNKNQPWRECCSSSAAMVAEALKPGCINGSDDLYVSKYVNKYGDTTSHRVHTLALKELGIDSHWIYNGDFRDIDEQLEKGYPVMFAYLHRGSDSHPVGGHCAVIIGKEKDGYKINDPWGSYAPDFYDPYWGAGIYYPKSFFKSRWLVNQRKSGWMRVIDNVKV